MAYPILYSNIDSNTFQCVRPIVIIKLSSTNRIKTLVHKDLGNNYKNISLMLFKKHETTHNKHYLRPGNSLNTIGFVIFTQRFRK